MGVRFACVLKDNVIAALSCASWWVFSRASGFCMRLTRICSRVYDSALMFHCTTRTLFGHLLCYALLVLPALHHRPADLVRVLLLQEERLSLRTDETEGLLMANVESIRMKLW